MLAAQMVACHNMTMEMSKRAMHTKESAGASLQCVVQTAKVTITSSLQIDTL